MRADCIVDVLALTVVVEAAVRIGYPDIDVNPD